MSNEYRRRCFDEKGERCDLCGSEVNVVAHHIDGDRSNNDLGNLMPVCRSCHNSIHRGGADGLSDILPPEARSDRPEGRGPGMRPSIRVTHFSNGRVKDYAAENDLTTSEAYREIINRGLEELEEEE